jgi:hypothetical protein
MTAAVPKEIRIITEAKKYEEKEPNKDDKPIYRIRAVLPDSSYVTEKSAEESK